MTQHHLVRFRSNPGRGMMKLGEGIVRKDIE